MKCMAGPHLLLMYSDANENERLWVKVEQSPQTRSGAANKSPQLGGKKPLLLQTHLNNASSAQQLTPARENGFSTPSPGAAGRAGGGSQVVCLDDFPKACDNVGPSLSVCTWGVGGGGGSCIRGGPVSAAHPPPPSLKPPRRTGAKRKIPPTPSTVAG